MKFGYKACRCGQHCFLFQVYSDQPCWGEIELIEDSDSELDYFYIHTCQGHKPIQELGAEYKSPYKKKKYPQKINLL